MVHIDHQVPHSGNHDSVHLYTDGGSRGNPGPAAAAFIITDTKGTVLRKNAKTIGRATSNVAEYIALIRGLAACAQLTIGSVHCTSDSILIVRQMTGKFRVLHPRLRILHEDARARARSFRRVTYEHRPRSSRMIAAADRLANEALDALERELYKSKKSRAGAGRSRSVGSKLNSS